ncbi:hypothetical protein BWI93_03060 [Siphonobacter sp. BAB-5385]|nr:hypothetical protein BWI93_03060 [Siphonobacter sp. BAB-5385]
MFYTCFNGFSQNCKDGLHLIGEGAYPKRFDHIIKQGGLFEVISNNARVYDCCGTPLKIKKGKILKVSGGDFFQGEYDGHSGMWIQQYIDFDGPGPGFSTELYIFEEDVKPAKGPVQAAKVYTNNAYRDNPETVKKVDKYLANWREQIEFEKRERERKATIRAFQINVFMGICALLILYGLFIYIRRKIKFACRLCKAWNPDIKKERSDGYTEKVSSYVRHPVMNSGVPTGSYVNILETRDVTRYTITYNCTCKKCGHNWTFLEFK